MVQGTPRTLQLHSKNIYVRMPRKEHSNVQKYCFFLTYARITQKIATHA